MVELTKNDKKQLENSYEFGFEIFWKCLEESKAKDLDTEAVGMEIFYQSIHFLKTKGWGEDDILNYMKNIYKDIIDNELYQKELTKIKLDHRKAGDLTDKERLNLLREKKILKEGDYADLPDAKNREHDSKGNNIVDMAKDINSEELVAAKPEAESMN